MTSRKRIHARLAAIAAGIIVLVLVPYLLWHKPMDAYFQSPEFAAWVASAKPYA